MILYHLLLYSSYLTLFGSTFIGILFYRRIERPVKVLVLFLLFSCLFEILCIILKSFDIHNLGEMNIYNLIEYSVCIFILYKWSEVKWLSVALLVSIIIYFAVWVFTTFYVLDFNTYNSYIRMLEAVSMIFFSGTILVQLSGEIKINLFKEDKFWIATAWFFYFAINAVIYTLSGILLKKFNSTFTSAWMIKAIIDIFANLLFSIAILCNSQKQKSYSGYLQ